MPPTGSATKYKKPKVKVTAPTPQGKRCAFTPTALDVNPDFPYLSFGDMIPIQQTFAELGGSAMMVITHDISLMAYLCDRVIVMYLGEVIETGPAEVLASEPLHP